MSIVYLRIEDGEITVFLESVVDDIFLDRDDKPISDELVDSSNVRGFGRSYLYSRYRNLYRYIKEGFFTSTNQST